MHVAPFGERNDHADVNETSTVEQQIDDVGEYSVFSVFVKEPIPGKGGSAGESRE